jgi:hypothetical protein
VACIITLPLAITPSTRVGFYEVIAPIGAGGMVRTVYRVHDDGTVPRLEPVE